jgi:hypothetical protein
MSRLLGQPDDPPGRTLGARALHVGTQTYRQLGQVLVAPWTNPADHPRCDAACWRRSDHPLARELLHRRALRRELDRQAGRADLRTAIRGAREFELTGHRRRHGALFAGEAERHACTLPLGASMPTPSCLLAWLLEWA